jgi:hypothetical protein
MRGNAPPPHGLEFAMRGGQEHGGPMHGDRFIDSGKERPPLIGKPFRDRRFTRCRSKVRRLLPRSQTVAFWPL